MSNNNHILDLISNTRSMLVNFLGSEKPDNPNIGDCIIQDGKIFIYTGDKYDEIGEYELDGNYSTNSSSTYTFTQFKCECCSANLTINENSPKKIKCTYCGTEYYNTNYIKLEKVNS